MLAHSNKLITFNHKNADSMAAIIAHAMFTITACALYLISCGCARMYIVLLTVLLQYHLGAWLLFASYLAITVDGKR